MPNLRECPDCGSNTMRVTTVNGREWGDCMECYSLAKTYGEAMYSRWKELGRDV